ncbi:MAG: hypothetical protein J5825_03875 [Lachnospiraceae bacterium]|nr:hypothetical protein [Lachnospiraceae bacterium]
MRKIICFGDSNTWGYDPAGGGRLPGRWPVVLAGLLGNKYQVVEEAQNGRTIACPDPWEWGDKAGIDYILPMLESQMPFDDLIIMLGSNDLKKKFHLPAGDIAGSLQNILMRTKSFLKYHLGCEPRIIVISPVYLGENALTGPFADFFTADSVEQSHKLAYWYQLVAAQFDAQFMDAAQVASPGELDGLHMTAEGHSALAKAVYEKFYQTEIGSCADSSEIGCISDSDPASASGDAYTTQIERLQNIVAKLRDPEGGCPWDLKQTHESLKPECVEEAAEVVCGINIFRETGKAENLREELGDLLLQVVMHARIAEEEGLFTFEDVAKTVSDKMIRRHPHVFGDRTLGEEQIRESWKEIKKSEKQGREWEEAYLPEAFREAAELIEVAVKRKGLDTK